MRTTQLLVIEDDEQTREALGLLLAGAGHRVTLARDGREGLQKSAEGRPGARAAR
jgi:CheY-like chemotaxis protein